MATSAEGTDRAQTIKDAIHAVASASGEMVDSMSLQDALDAHAAGRPVFWKNRQYHDALATVFLDKVHRMGLVPAIWEMGEQYPSHPQAAPGALLLRLTPITASARRELAKASIHFGLGVENVRRAAA